MSERRGSLGLPTMEIAIVVALVGVFAAIFTHQLFYYWELAERTTVDLTINNMRSGLRLEMARRLMAGERRTYTALAHGNPMTLLQTPDNYLGEQTHVDPTRIKPGHWVFSQNERALYYIPRHSRYLNIAPQQKLAFLKFVLESKQEPSEISEYADIPEDVKLISVWPYRWF